MLFGFFHRGGIEQWSYAIAADIAAQGGQFIRFTNDDVDFKNRTIVGEVWEDGDWVKKQSRFPDVIRNFELKKRADKILNSVPYSLGPIVRKNDQSELFNHAHTISKYIPETLIIDENCSVINNIKKWGAGLLKPSRGRLGQGIIFIKTIGENFEINDDGDIQILSENEFNKYLEPYYLPDAIPYIVQQFAAGTGPQDRYFNIRVIVTKSGDGDWHPCNFLISLLAKKGSIIANRDVGAKNIDLDSYLNYRYGDDTSKIYDELFSSAVQISRVLDDSVDKTAEEIALDMAIDNSGNIWLHEANWRGGLWLFDEDIGIYRHGGSNLKRIGLQSKAGNNIQRAEAVNIAIENREEILEYCSKESNCKFTDGVTFGIELKRNTEEIPSLVSSAITYGLPILSVSSSSSFRATQRVVPFGVEAISEQIPTAHLPFVISKGGACVYDPKADSSYAKWINDELFKTDLIDSLDLKYGFSLSSEFLKYTIKENKKDLNVSKLDMFVIEGLEYSLKDRKNWEQKWLDAAYEMEQALKYNTIEGWGFSLSTKTIFNDNYTDPIYLLGLLKKRKYKLPTVFYLDIDVSYNHKDIGKLLKRIDKLNLQLVISLPAKKLAKKQWNESHKCVPVELIKEIKRYAKKGQIILCPAETKKDIIETLSLINNIDNLDDKSTIFKKLGNPWFINDKQKVVQYLGKISMKKEVKQTKKEQLKFKKRMEALATMSKFDHRQLFRFFVDGRFNEKYKGWSGYEANEQGSVPGLLSAYCYVLDNFDISKGLNSTYIRQLHALCMKNVITKNPKSAPGDMRYLEAGFNIFSHYSTVDSIGEIIDIRKGDGTPLFHTRGFEKTADNFTAQGVFESLKEKKRLKFRPWYPVLTNEQKNGLNDPGDLSRFYKVKHFVQESFAVRIDEIVHHYNDEIKKVSNNEETLIAISRVVRNLEMLHPFPDGNGRAFVAILMNHLLLFNGFLPAVLFDPNIDIELSVKEFAQEMKVGMANTKLLLKDPTAVVYKYSISQSSQEDIKAFEILSKDLVTRLSPYSDLNFDVDSFETNNFKASYIYLTPSRIVQLTKGSWMNANENTLSTLRFESIQIDHIDSPNQLFFFRNIKTWIESTGDDPLKYIERLSQNGVTAIVVDDISIAKESSIPALYVDDIDDALAVLGRATRREINCKAIAVVGSTGKTTTKTTLNHILNEQIEVHSMVGNDNKTPYTMVSLSNLRLTDNLEINEIAVATRPNPASYRSRGVAPDIVLLTNLNLLQDSDSFENSIQSFAAIVDGIKDGGVYLINSQCEYLDDLIDAIMDRKEVSIQTYGILDDDIAKVIEAKFDKNNMVWDIKANIIGDVISYKVKGSASYLPISSVGMLLAIANLGYDVKEAAKQFLTI